VTGFERATVSLDGEWRFIADPERLYGGDRPFPDGEPIQVPGCWEAQVARPYRIITAWYRRVVDIPADWKGDRVVFRFGAVMYRCSVRLNGVRIGGHEGGYTAFEVEARDAVRWGQPNPLDIQVINPLNAIGDYPAFSVDKVLLAEEFEPDLPLSEAPHGKQTWYASQSGLWQSVSMERRPRVALGPLRVDPDVPGERAVVRWSLDLGGGAREEDAARSEIRLRVIGPDGAEAATDIVRPDAMRGERSIPLATPRLWDIDAPNLYTVEAELVLGDTVVDGLRARFGMREITTKDGRVLLNGRPIYLLGALDQDLYPDTISTPPSRAYLDEQIRRARELGVNLLRCHIKVPDPAYLDAADEAGMLLWCELPNWTTFSYTAAARGRATLARMVETMGNHPSIVIWTIINEDWGTEVRKEARDRHWLLETYDWLKELDPTRLVVDNSACETPETPNFHLKSDLADFHVYFAAPDNAIRWRTMIEDFARRPAWLWSPHGDAEERGDEPLVLSEFGSWGLPRLDRLVDHYGGEPWWFATGQGYYRPTGLRRRFETYGLDRIWPSIDHLADATQWHQFDAMQYEIGEMRRHGSIQGYVITELTDAYWEANGILDPMRGPKVYHERLGIVNAPEVVVASLDRRDVCSGDPFSMDLTVSSYGGPGEPGGRIEWEVQVVGDPTMTSGSVALGEWPDGGVRHVGRVEGALPDVERVSDGRLHVRAYDGSGRLRARDEIRLAILPAASQRTDAPRTIAVHDPLDIWRIRGRVTGLGHDTGGPGKADLVVASELTDDILGRIEDGGRALILVRDRDSIPREHDLARRIQVHLRRLPHAGWPGQRSPWEGDWVTSYSWILHEALPGLPERNPLDFAYEEVLPDHVMLGYDPVRHRDEVPSGMFVGWVHAPGANVWTFRQGRGAVTITTFRVAPESGPVATLLLEQLIQRAASADRRGRPRERQLEAVG
jgi:hypothetical protein